MKKHKRIIIIFILACLLIYVAILFDGYLATYRFAILKTEYSNYFSDEYNQKGLNPKYFALNTVVNNYSPVTDIIIDDAQKDEKGKNNFTIEHSVRVTNYDVHPIPSLKNEGFPNYLFIAIEIPFNNVSEIDLRNYYNGKELEEFGTFIYKYKKDPKGRVLYSEKVDVKDITNNKVKIQEQDHFVYVRIYKFPGITRNKFYTTLVPKKYWFRGDMTQTLNIMYLNDKDERKEVSYKFNLVWVKWMSVIDKMMTI